ncbi:division/outer membrane stress-associated lipid-binding lipoprotein [Zophobihabitans entericus]|uniref:Divisome-associated lipoprotein YraP n=1 Tax=Zophobihabitans entericus TaxID=1635327 RepID=A0A6G9I979_9GAMM|nr:division/outer membrane stress-associated lipid-binding lipoprotein [Zophobihabitans entericus]QIQ20274.1 divisome-associated lipoprotein YraP [Zophobihabitans entericus]
MKRFAYIAMILSGALLLQGCVAVAIGTAAGVTAKTASDPRTVGTQVDDTTLDSRVGIKLKDHESEFQNARIVATSYNGSVLLTGQAADETQIQRAADLTSETDGVVQVYNQIRLGEKIGAGTLTNDAWITTKVKTQLVANSETKARNIKVVTENSEVFLMGIVTRDEARTAAEVASKVAGVKLVVTAFTYIEE